ncbi:hypothetical protein MSAN_01822300 [Mycena sanguinolenta]|uniref:Uncharacterized protein n=1 Tax=Mycena sanguinolenta TaxID=230812 RepID=A0A8H6XTD0_9AGAR|nr:hypothetical protein MSAN_01822300 [Mycena sanguinolenta]
MQAWLIPLLFLSSSAYSQFEDTIALTVPDVLVDPTSAAIFSYAWVGDPGHQLKNISMELIRASASADSDSVADIVVWGYTQQNGNTILYPLHAATPPGSYHIRMNATIYSGSLPLSTIVTNSRTFNISLVTSYQCETPTFTPVTSISDVTYSPLRLVTPMAGAVFPRNILNSNFGNITGSLYIVDGSFNTESINATLELVSLGTGFTTPVQQVPQTAIDTRSTMYSTSKITLAPGTTKLRMNFTDSTENGAPCLTSLSDEFYIAIDSPCVGLSSGTSASAASASSTTSPPSSALSTSTAGQSNSSSRIVLGGSSLVIMLNFLSLSLIILVL